MPFLSTPSSSPFSCLWPQPLRPPPTNTHPAFAVLWRQHLAPLALLMKLPWPHPSPPRDVTDSPLWIPLSDKFFHDRLIYENDVVAVSEMEQYLDYIGGPAGALALTGVAAASAYYLASRPAPQKPLVDLNKQSDLLPVSTAKQILTHKGSSTTVRLRFSWNFGGYSIAPKT